MNKKKLRDCLKLYFITDHQLETRSMITQVKLSLSGGATMIQYRNKNFRPDDILEVYEIAVFCRLQQIPFIINDDILLAKAVNADGVHLGQDDQKAGSARKVLGKDKIIGISISNSAEFKKTDLTQVDYIGLGPVFDTATKPDAKKASGLTFLKKISEKTDLPIVAIGGINLINTPSVINSGACGISIISAISRAENIEEAANNFSSLLNILPVKIKKKWSNEFALIDSLQKFKAFHNNLKIEAGDDAALLNELKRPVISTDTQRENVHFKLKWQSFYEIGFKAVSVSLSDLAASYAEPESVFINLGIPSHVSDSDIQELYRGINDNLMNYSASIGGGNISKAEMLSIDIFAVGEGDFLFPKRSCAKTDQLICTTGDLGLARAGLEILSAEVEGHDYLAEKFKFPKPRFDAAEILKGFDIDCVTDISDGLYGDLGHICRQSGVSAVLTPDEFRINENLKKYCLENEKNPEEYIISGGEDYELLFTCNNQIFPDIQKKLGSVFVLGKIIKQCREKIKCDFKGLSFNHGK